MDVQQAIADLFAREEATADASPGIATRVAALLRTRDFAIADLAQLAACDPAIAVELLCAPEARGTAGASIPRALESVGERGLVAIAGTVARGAVESASGPLAPERRGAWRQALSSAVLCRELARVRGLPEDDAYACGLLHDIGRILALSALEQLSAGSRADGAEPALGWHRIVARWHVPLGAVFASRRGLPNAVVDTIALHHADPAAAPSRSPELVRIVRTVDSVLRVLGGGAPTEADLPPISELDAREAERLAIARDALLPRLAALDAVPAAAPHAAAALRGAAPGARTRGVVLRIAGHEYAGCGFAAGQLVVAGAVALGEGGLVEVEPIQPWRARFHAVVVASWADGGVQHAIVAPLALSGAPADVGATAVA